MADVELALLIDRFMRQIHFSLQSKAPSFDRKNVGSSGGIVLLTLADMGPVSMQELTKRVMRDKSQMTRTIRSLETKGLVHRDTSPDDARVTMVFLTEDGVSVVDDLKRVLADVIGTLLEPIDKTDQDVLKNLVKQVFT